MTHRLLLVDFENVKAVDLASVPPDVRVRVVLGAKIAQLPTELALQAQAMGDRFAYVAIRGVAPNAVDFCIAFYLGEYLANDPTAECVILSRDKKGFDPLVKHLVTQRQFNVRRVDEQRDAFSSAIRKKQVEVGDPYQRTLEILAKEKSKPQKRSGLLGKIKSYHPQLSDEQQSSMADRLFKDGKVAEIDGKLQFAL